MPSANTATSTAAFEPTPPSSATGTAVGLDSPMSAFASVANATNTASAGNAENRPATPGSGATAAVPRLINPRAFTCRCGRPVFFRNSECLACHRPLGYATELGMLLPLEAAGEGIWRADGSTDDDDGHAAPTYRRCANLKTPAGCNWLLANDDGVQDATRVLCRCCRLTRTLPDLSVADHALWWNRIELAKRRLVSSLIGLALPVLSKEEDPMRGLAFDLLRGTPGGPGVVTGHEDGVVTLDVEEAEDAWREQRRTQLREPYRTLLGHLRHETGHYYWQRLVDRTAWMEPFRSSFGDERQNYSAALAQHYRNGAPADWNSRYVSAYASSHPWEDWAETWAHYLHMRDTLDTARSFGLDGERVELSYERFDSATPGMGQHPADFLSLINSWMELTGVLNELSRSIGVADFYPFVLSEPAVAKLHLVHRVVMSAAASASATAPTGLA